MSEVQESDVLETTTEDVTSVETQSQDDKSPKPEKEPENASEDATADEESAEGEEDGEPEISLEERLTQLERDVASKQKAINRKTAAYSDLQKAHERQLKEFKALEERVQVEAPDLEPKIDDYDSYQEYDDARLEYLKSKAEQEAQTNLLNKQREEQQQALKQEREAESQRQETEYLKVNPSYSASKEEFLHFIQTVKVSPAVENAFVEQIFEGNVPEIIDYFGRNNGENMDKLHEIAKMSPVKAGIEVYKIQQSLKTPQKKEVKPASVPVKKPRGAGAQKKSLDDAEDVLAALGLK